MKIKTKTKKHYKQIKRLVTKKKLFKRKTSKLLLRYFFVLVVSVSAGWTLYAAATTKPTVSADLRADIQPKSVNIDITENKGGPDQVGSASWYALGLPAPDAFSCASTRFPRGTYLHVTSKRNGKSVTCLVNDYGPEAWTLRVIDLSRGSFRAIEDLSRGTVPVEIRVVNPPASMRLTLPSSFSALTGYDLCKLKHSDFYCEVNRKTPNSLQ